jgi:hypothetical protein
MSHRMANLIACALLALGSAGARAGTPPAPGTLDTQAAVRFAALALQRLHQPYPNPVSHTNADADARPPRTLTPAFYGRYHSLRSARTLAAGAALTPEHVAAKLAYLKGDGRASFERPYGLAWLLPLRTN